MTTTRLAVIICWTFVAYGCTPRTPEMQFIYDVGEVMGGESNIAETETLLLDGDGRQYRLGQNSNPGETLPYWAVDEYQREYDLVNNRWRVVQRRTSRYLTGNPVTLQEQTFGVDGDIGYDISEAGAVRRAPGQTTSDRRADYYHHPVTLIQLALTEGSVVGNLRQEGGEDVVDITAGSGETYTMYVDPTTKYPTRIVSPGVHGVLGDVTLTTRFEDYAEPAGFGGMGIKYLTLPRGIEAMTDDFTIWELRVENSTIGDPGDLSAPEEARSTSASEFMADVQVEEVGDGIWRLAGQSHHSFLVEFSDFLALVEAPQNDARTLAVIARARELQPDKPLQYVINTHHHFDHSGGIRAAVSEGLTVIAHQTNAEFYEDLVQRPHTRMPDALASNPQELTLELVGNEIYELGEGRRTLQIARVRPDQHTDAMLVGYLPLERTLIEADLYTANSVEAPFAANLLRTIEEREWRVDQVLPIHGQPFEVAVLEDAAGAGSPR
jgi:glyoxylase-like metal-dependent hydrolase (beta-lactamase superfamily II)